MTPQRLSDPVLRLVVERAYEGSRPGARSDGARLALVVEGGGMAGAVSAGMCAALDALRLIESFDVVYGSSAGAINASYAVAGQAWERRELYVLAAQRGVIDLRRAALLRPPFRLAQIATQILDAHLRHRVVLDSTIPLRVTAARVEDKGLDVLSGFTSPGELRAALLASCANPVLVGDIVEFRGRRYVDGGLIESVPFRVALREGATHVLVLRSRHAHYRAPEFRGVRRQVLTRVLRNAPDTATEMVFAWPALYNTDAQDLLTTTNTAPAGRVTQLTPSPDPRATSSYETRPTRLRHRIALGARSVYECFDTVRATPAQARQEAA